MVCLRDISVYTLHTGDTGDDNNDDNNNNNNNNNEQNLNIAWIDYKKAFDSVPHSWVEKCNWWE
jgi:hypothetical protein